MSTRGATPSATLSSEMSQEILKDSEMKVVNLQDVLEHLRDDKANLPSHIREYFIPLPTTYKKLMADPAASKVKLDPSGFMRSNTLRKDWEENKNVPFFPRKSNVDSILVQQIDCLHKTNDGSMPVGVKFPGIKGRCYGPGGETDRFVDIIPHVTSAPIAQKSVHRPSLDSLAIIAANFSDVTEQSLRSEYQKCLGADHQSLLVVNDRCKILASLRQITENLSPTVCAQYDFDPRKLNLLEADPAKNRPGYLVLPTAFLDAAVKHILEAKDSLKHMNPIVDGTQFSIEFCPTKVSSWQKFDEHPLYQAWKALGKDYLEEKLNTPFTLFYHMQMTVLPNDEITQEALKSGIEVD